MKVYGFADGTWATEEDHDGTGAVVETEIRSAEAESGEYATFATAALRAAGWKGEEA